jgi:hypothetical protein
VLPDTLCPFVNHENDSRSRSNKIRFGRINNKSLVIAAEIVKCIAYAPRCDEIKENSRSRLNKIRFGRINNKSLVVAVEIVKCIAYALRCDEIKATV